MRTAALGRGPRVVLLLAITLGTIMVGAPPASAACYWHSGKFTFDKNTNTNSTLYYRYRNSCDTLTYETKWRSGSGVSVDPCESDRGWLPNGTYDVRETSHDWNKKIDGRVWYISDKACAAKGTLRFGLFIHTEEKSAGANNCDGNAATDNAYCWDGVKDYKSEGCIKVATRPGDDAPSIDHIGDAHWYWHNRAGGGDGRGPWPAKVIVVA